MPASFYGKIFKRSHEVPEKKRLHHRDENTVLIIATTTRLFQLYYDLPEISGVLLKSSDIFLRTSIIHQIVRSFFKPCQPEYL
jgi:hypothetical protein